MEHKRVTWWRRPLDVEHLLQEHAAVSSPPLSSRSMPNGRRCSAAGFLIFRRLPTPMPWFCCWRAPWLRRRHSPNSTGDLVNVEPNWNDVVSYDKMLGLNLSQCIKCHEIRPWTSLNVASFIIYSISTNSLTNFNKTQGKYLCKFTHFNNIKFFRKFKFDQYKD